MKVFILLSEKTLLRLDLTRLKGIVTLIYILKYLFYLIKAGLTQKIVGKSGVGNTVILKKMLKTYQ
ncbi:hypothetical protein CXF74_18835 [Psychromonas sp. Urea-02u-13]|nr:hypothetical protein CXF74_18835 [Psychromonas sp. Urea-02u-13]